MPTDLTAEDVAKQYGLEPLSDDVRRLTSLVAQQNTDLDEFAKLVARDQNLTRRLLRAANPKAEREADYTVSAVDQALMRCGIGGALLLAMSDALTRSVTKTFQTMLDTKIENIFLTRMNPFREEHVLGEVRFSGHANGFVDLRLEPAAAAVVAGRMLGMDPSELGSVAEIDGVIGELSNIVVGNFKSNLCNAGLECKLSLPQITRTSDFKFRTVSGSFGERTAFRAPQISLFVDISVNPWGK